MIDLFRLVFYTVHPPRGVRYLLYSEPWNVSAEVGADVSGGLVASASAEHVLCLSTCDRRRRLCTIVSKLFHYYLALLFLV